VPADTVNFFAIAHWGRATVKRTILVCLIVGAGFLFAGDISSVKGTCSFGNTKSTWSAVLKVREDGAYNASYVSIWSGKTLSCTGVIKTDGKTWISGYGKASGGAANGTFEFSGR